MHIEASRLGRLETVQLREVWTNEAGEFTPWLASQENIALLGETIGIELELEAQEKNVGPFRADILCKDALNETWVLIENQLERTNHAHLGQLLTYAAGLKAVTIVWIAARFTEEHRAALDWLNEITDAQFNFFGLEVELWRIGQSPAAPKFNVVCKPNNWSKDVKAVASRVDLTSLSETRRLQLDFWTAFADYISNHGSNIKPMKPRPQHWMSFAAGRSGFHFSAIASSWDSEGGTYDAHELRVQLIIHKDKAAFKELRSMDAEIKAEFEDALTWHDSEDEKGCKIYLRRSADLSLGDEWPEYHSWLLDRLESFYRVFVPRIRRLSGTVGSETIKAVAG